MWFDGIRQPNTMYVASVSRGKDSTAMLRAIQLMGWPLDAICSVDIWFDEDTHAELPPVVAFKDEWDAKCLDWFGVPVTRLCAHKRESSADGECHSRESYTSYFYRRREGGKFCGAYVGFPMQRGSWCKKLKYEQVDLCGYLLSQGVPGERERESCGKAETRSETSKSWGTRKSEGAGANPTSNDQHSRLPKQSMPLVYRGTQKFGTTIKGFPWRKGAWCQDRLKGNGLDRVFR